MLTELIFGTCIMMMNGSNLTHKKGFYYIKKMSESANLTYYQKS